MSEFSKVAQRLRAEPWVDRWAARGVRHCVAGLALSFGRAVLLRHLLTMINAFDFVSYLSEAVVVALASLAAAYFPSSRAARINSVETLRAD